MLYEGLSCRNIFSQVFLMNVTRQDLIEILGLLQRCCWGKCNLPRHSLLLLQFPRDPGMLQPLKSNSGFVSAAKSIGLEIQLLQGHFYVPYNIILRCSAGWGPAVLPDIPMTIVTSCCDYCIECRRLNMGGVIFAQLRDVWTLLLGVQFIKLLHYPWFLFMQKLLPCGLFSSLFPRKFMEDQ